MQLDKEDGKKTTKDFFTYPLNTDRFYNNFAMFQIDYNRKLTIRQAKLIPHRNENGPALQFEA